MRVKGPFPADLVKRNDVSPLVGVYFEFNQLKQLYRQGWLRRGIPPEQTESVADHILSMTLLAWWIADAYFPSLDANHVIRLCLAHELGEIYTGDLTPSDPFSPEEKHRREREALLRITAPLPNGADLLALWEEFEVGETVEARFVRQLDRLEMAFQAVSYEQQGFGSLEEFLATTRLAVHDPILQSLLAELETLRNTSG